MNIKVRKIGEKWGNGGSEDKTGQGEEKLMGGRRDVKGEGQGDQQIKQKLNRRDDGAK